MGALVATLGALWLIWGGFLPNSAGRLGVDYAFWLPNLLSGDFWHRAAPTLAMPWFLPSHCAGVPWQADPQGAYLSLPQLLTFATGPLRAVQLCFLAYAACGFAGTCALAARCFRCSRPASVLAACLFALNGFYAARMMVGHLSFAPFMLLPWLCLCLLVRPRKGGRWRAGPILAFAVLLATLIQSGAAVLILPAYLSLIMLVVMHALATGGGLRLPARRLAIGTALGLALCTGKLAAVFALMAHVPRDLYPLPGLPNIALSAWMALRCLFLWPTATMTGELVNNALTLEPHEFDYRVGPVPLLLMALGWFAG